MKIHIKHIISGLLCIAVMATNLAVPINASAINISNSKQNKVTFSPMAATSISSGSLSGKMAKWSTVSGAAGTVNYTVTLYDSNKSDPKVATVNAGFYTSPDGLTMSYDFSNYITTTGHYYFTVAAIDSYSSTNIATFTSKIYVFYSSLSMVLKDGLSSSTSGGIINTAKPTITGTIGTNNNTDNGLSGDTVTLFEGTNAIGNSQITGAAFSVTCSVPLTDGTHFITAVVSNSSGKSDLSDPLSIITDTKRPAGYSIDNSLSAISAANLASYSFTIDNAEVGCTYNYTIAGTGNSSVSGSGTVDSVNKTVAVSNAANLKEGKLTLSVYLTDDAGNSGNTVSATTVKNTGTAPAINTVSLQDGFMGRAYSQPLTASNSPTSWRISYNNLPDGLSLDINTGVITGTPTKAGTFTFGVTATNDKGDGPEQQFTVKIFVAPTIITTTLPDGTINTSYLQTLQALNTPTSWSITSGSLPTGLSLNTANGIINGTPTVAGTYTFYVTATNIAGSSSQQLTIKIQTVPVITTAGLPSGNVSTQYSQTLTATNLPTSWRVSSGTLPTGLSLNTATGVISGTPTTAGTYTFSVIAANSVGNSSAQLFSVTITATPSITTASLPDGKIGTAYTQTLIATNKPTSWSIISGSLPTGISFNTTTGVISGTPTTVGTYTFSMLATNEKGSSSIKPFTVTIYGIPAITTTSLPNGNVNIYFYQSLSAINTPITWSIVSGTMPAGLVMNANTGLITGYPTTVGVYTFSVTATNPAGISVAQQLTIVITNVSAPPVDITINGSGNTTASTAKIVSSNTNIATTKNVIVNLNSAEITASASLFSSIIGGNDANWLEMTQSSDAKSTASAAAATAGLIPLFSFDLNLTRHNSDSTTTAVHQLGGNITCTVALTDAQKSKLNGLINPCLLYYDPDTKTLTDMKAVFNLYNGTATFSTTHLSSFVIAAKVPKYNVGIAYRSYVQRLGWQSLVSKGSSGTTGRSLGLQALKIALSGTLPSGASVTYQTYVHGKGWQKAVSNGAASNAIMKNLNMEELRISIKGLSGYQIRYRVYIQKRGWLGWKTTANGTDIKKASIVGIASKGLRIESVQIMIQKVSKKA